jgi:hypothetical protein
MSKIHSLSTWLLLAGSLCILSPAYALDVSYQTTGTFSGGSNPGTSTFKSGGLTIQYTGVGAMSPNVTAPPLTNISLGTFQVTGSGTISGTFTLAVTQDTPGPVETETFVSVPMSKNITKTNSSVVIRFLALGSGAGGQAVLDTDPDTFVAAQTFSLNGVEYWVDEIARLNPQNTLQGLSFLDGTISATPEPGFYALTGMGLAGVFVVVRRRRKRPQA